MLSFMPEATTSANETCIQDSLELPKNPKQTLYHYIYSDVCSIQDHILICSVSSYIVVSISYIVQLLMLYIISQFIQLKNDLSFINQTKLLHYNTFI